LIQKDLSGDLCLALVIDDWNDLYFRPQPLLGVPRKEWNLILEQARPEDGKRWTTWEKTVRVATHVCSPDRDKDLIAENLVVQLVRLTLGD